MSTFDYSKTYYKLMNKDEVHHGFRYTSGLNVLDREFDDDPYNSCSEGGLYFSDLPNLFHWMTSDIYWIREVKVPGDARVVKPYAGRKYRADKIILGRRTTVKDAIENLLDYSTLKTAEEVDTFLISILENYDPSWQWFSEKVRAMIDWEVWSYVLLSQYSHRFEKWFDEDRFDYRLSGMLATFARKHILQWFNREKFDWADGSYALAWWCNDTIDFWWDKNKFNWRKGSYTLAKRCDDNITLWWDKDKFDWGTGSEALATNTKINFFFWWNPDKFNWKASHLLPESWPQYVDIWMDKNKFNWEKGSIPLVKYCKDKIESWWDPDKFNWKIASGELALNCPEYFHLWWNKRKYNYKFGEELIKGVPKHFKTWWDRKKFFAYKSNSITQLANIAPEYFDKWWNPDRFDWNYLDWLVRFCSEHFPTWWSEYKLRSPNNPDYYCYKDLAMFCSDYFLSWWDPNRFPEALWHLIPQYCDKFFDVWKEDYFKQCKRTTYVETKRALIQYCAHRFSDWWDKIDIKDDGDLAYLHKFCPQYKDKWNPYSQEGD